MFFFEGTKVNKNNTAIITEKNEFITYEKLTNYIDKFSKNIRNKSLVFIICKNNLESIVSYLSFMKSKCVISLLDENISEKSLQNLIKNYRPEYIFFDKKRKINLENYSSTYSFYNHELLVSKKKYRIKLNNQLSLLISTSGSTGTSKFVRQSNKNLHNNTKIICDYLSISEKDTTITTLPMSYVYGLSIINTHLYSGSSIVLNSKSLVEKDFWKSLQKNKVTNFGGVPYTYSILERINLNNFNLKYLRYTTQAGGKLNKITAKNILNKYKNLNIKLCIMYGAAEATARMSYVPFSDIKNKISSIGKPINGGKFFIIDQNERRVTKPNIIGELYYKGKNVCLGYANSYKDLSKGDTNKGILRTGDLAYKDKGGYYYIAGRKDRYIKIYGLRVNLQELEEIIFDFGVENMCVEEKLNKILIYVKNFKNFYSLIKYINKETNLHPSSFKIINIKEFPLNKNLKISYAKNLITNNE